MRVACCLAVRDISRAISSSSLSLILALRSVILGLMFGLLLCSDDEDGVSVDLLES